MKGRASSLIASIAFGCLCYGPPLQAQEVPNNTVTKQNPVIFQEQPGAVYGYYDIQLAISGSYLDVVAGVLSSKEFETGMIFVCAALSYDVVDCTTAAQAVSHGGQIYTTLAVASRDNVRPGIVPPRGYDLCQAVIDVYSITKATFSATVLNYDDVNTLDDKGNLSGPFYIAMDVTVKSGTGEGEWSKANLAVQFVPLGDRVKRGCLPVGFNMVSARGQNIKFGAPGLEWKK